ncbi:MAG TPA: energy transducer TonB [Gemmatimonadaceae bacterium]|nr:energy transducer TonB [Gemmatimonadaceae bacterium]
MSVAAHVAVAGALVATAAHATRSAPERPSAVVLRFPPPPAIPIRAQSGPPAAGPAFAAPRIDVSRLVLDHVPRAIPPVVNVAATLADLPIGPAAAGAARGVPTGIVDTGDGSPADEQWVGAAVLTHLLATATPRYPESLRDAGVDGEVLVQFTVDTSGRVDASTIRVLRSTHGLFTRAVLDALRRFRFAPAVVGGRRVPALAEMPFEFRIAR